MEKEADLTVKAASVHVGVGSAEITLLRHLLFVLRVVVNAAYTLCVRNTCTTVVSTGPIGKQK